MAWALVTASNIEVKAMFAIKRNRLASELALLGIGHLLKFDLGERVAGNDFDAARRSQR